VDVDVDADERLAAGQSQHQVGALGPHAGQGKQHLPLAGQRAIIFIHHALSDDMQLSGLVFVERAGADDGFDLVQAEPAEACGVRASANSLRAVGSMTSS